MNTLSLRDPAYLAQVSGPVYTDSPDNYASLVRWYVSSDYDGDGLADNDPVVNNWPDHSLSLEDAIPDGANAPHFKLAFTPSGKNCLLFLDGWHHFDHTELILGDFTFLIVWRPMADAICFSSSSGNYQVRNTTGGVPASWTPALYPNAPPTLTNNTADNNQLWQMHTWRRTAATGVPRFGYNKTYVGDGSGNTNTNDMKCNTVGLFNGGPGYFYALEACVFNGVLLDAELDSLYDGYFNVKYLGDIGS